METTMSTPLRVLLVEDSEDDAALVLRELKRNGYEPAWQRVETPEALASALDGGAWDLVISDHSMPYFSGPAALALVRKRGLDLPVIIVSGTVGEEAAVEAMKAGAQDFILKGRLARLPGAVQRELQETELRRTHARTQEALQKTRLQLDGAMQQLLQAEKLTALGELVAGVAHEINNPLSSIMGYAQLLLGRDVSPDVKRRLETMFSEAERIGRIVKNLLTFARKHPPERKWLGLNGIIEKTLELKAYHFKVSQIRVEKDLASDLPMTMLDFHQIQQVLLNLLNNAEQAMGEAGRGGTIRLTTRRKGDRIETRIADDGPGVPAEIQTRIFEPFFTTKKEGKGTGLGLSLCYGIVQEHGGTIRVEGAPGTGATFVIDFPVIGKEVSTETAPNAPTPALSGLRILVIDDEPGVQDFLADFLTSMGHKVDTASDAPEGMKKIAANGHDLIISDMKMPNGSGVDIYKTTLQKNPRLARRIIFTTGDGASAETLRFLKETGNEIVAKPYRIEEIERAIARASSN
jgi:signal transduction histidine kinase